MTFMSVSDYMAARAIRWSNVARAATEADDNLHSNYQWVILLLGGLATFLAMPILNSTAWIPVVMGIQQLVDKWRVAGNFEEKLARNNNTIADLSRFNAQWGALSATEKLKQAAQDNAVKEVEDSIEVLLCGSLGDNLKEMQAGAAAAQESLATGTATVAAATPKGPSRPPSAIGGLGSPGDFPPPPPGGPDGQTFSGAMDKAANVQAQAQSQAADAQARGAQAQADAQHAAADAQGRVNAAQSQAQDTARTASESAAHTARSANETADSHTALITDDPDAANAAQAGALDSALNR